VVVVLGSFFVCVTIICSVVEVLVVGSEVVVGGSVVVVVIGSAVVIVGINFVVVVLVVEGLNVVVACFNVGFMVAGLLSSCFTVANFRFVLGLVVVIVVTGLVLGFGDLGFFPEIIGNREFGGRSTSGLEGRGGRFPSLLP
jgi:hypothetical protein